MNTLLLSATSNDEEEKSYLFAMELSTISVLPLVMKTAIELNLFETIAKANKLISSSELASLLPTKNNPNAPMILDRMLRLLSSYSVLTCTHESVTNGHIQTQILYGLGPVCKYFMKNKDGVSLAPFLLGYQSTTFYDCWVHLKDVILEGGSPLYKAYGMDFFELAQKEDVPNFNEIMRNLTIVVMRKILEKYKGFEGLHQLVDVGGGLGANLSLIVSKYPQVKGINFDLPHVIKDAPYCPGIEHVGGDMFQHVPKGEAIFMKWIFHDWGDDQCLKILKNCYEALSEFGKVIVVEYIVPEFPENDIVSKNIFKFDIGMFVVTSEGKERTLKEFEILARGAGFAAIKLVYSTYGFCVIEFYKNL